MSDTRDESDSEQVSFDEGDSGSASRDDGDSRMYSPNADGEPGIHSPHDEADLRAMIEETGYDADLGMELARDAQLVTAGELSERAFYVRYHEQILEEFGTDDRPVELPDPDELDDEELEDAGLLDRLGNVLSGVDPNADQSRREMLKKTGAAAGAVGLAGWATADQASANDGTSSIAGDGDEDGTQWGMVIDLDKCDGCLACSVACSQENDLGPGENWMYVFTYEDDNQDGENFLVRPCMHCSDAPCTSVCPVNARHTREEDGLVLTDYEICIGCRYCQVSCPYGVNYFQWGEPDTPIEEQDQDHRWDGRDRHVDSSPPKGVMGKCTMCPSRQDGSRGEEARGTTACEQACTMDAIHFGDMNDPEDDPQQYLDRVREANQNDQSDYPNRSNDTVSTFRLKEELGTDPNVVYVGNEPSENARQVEGPVTYEQMGLLDERKEVLDEGAAANDGGETA